jgi:hypothetical protein
VKSFHRGYLFIVLFFLSGGSIFGQKTSNPTCTLVAGQCDDIPPIVLQISYPTTPVDVTTQSQNVPLTILAVDPLSGTEQVPPLPGGIASGVAGASINLQSVPCGSPLTAQTKYASGYAYASPPPTGYTQTTQQTLTGSIYFAQNSSSSSYYVCSASASDALGNSRYYSDLSSAPLAGLPAIQVTASPVPVLPVISG